MKENWVKFLSALACLTLAVGFAACGEEQAEIPGNPVDEQGVKYYYNEAEAAYAVYDFEEGKTTNVVIPREYYGIPVTSISYTAFNDCDSLTSVVIGDNVTSIDTTAFRDCDNLTSVTIGKNVTSIENYAFSDCTSLTSVEIPDNVTSIGDGVFKGCNSLTSVVIGDGVTSIKVDAFSDCTSLINVEISDNVTSIGGGAFRECSSLTNIAIPDSVNSIGSQAFSYCESLMSVVIPDSVNSIGSQAFSYCESLMSIVIGDSVASIESEAFYTCNRLVEVINKSPHIAVEKGNKENGYVGYYALAVYDSDSGITESQLLNDSGYIVYANETEKILVGYTGKAAEVILPSYITEIHNYAFRCCENLTSVVIPDDVVVNSSSFSGCQNLVSATIPADVLRLIPKKNLQTVVVTSGKIYRDRFRDCDSLTSVVIGDGVTYLDGFTFENFDSLTSVIIGNGVTTIYESTFEGCSSLTSIVISDSVDSIGRSAFKGCDSLTSVYYKGTAEEWSTISIGSYNTPLESATVYYYSELQPIGGNYWHYNENGEIVVW